VLRSPKRSVVNGESKSLSLDKSVDLSKLRLLLSPFTTDRFGERNTANVLAKDARQ
jgi:hypothetical protein